MKRSCVLHLVVILFFTVTCMVATSAFAQDKTITLRYADGFPPSHELAKIDAEWCKEVEKRTGGKVKARHYPGGTLAPPAQAYGSVAKGVIDVTIYPIGYTAGKFPLSDVLDHPLGYPSGYVSTKLVNEYYKKFKPKEFDEIQPMYFHAQPPAILNTKKPVTKMEDLKGMKIRTSGSVTDFISALGGVPVGMPIQEAYDSLSRGVADGLICAYEVLEGWKIGEVVKFTTENYWTSTVSVFIVAMNKDKWNSIAPEEQKIIEQINEEWIERQGKLWDKINESGKAFALQKGNKIITLSDQEQARWVAKAEPLFDKYVKNTKAKGLPGDEVLKFARDYLKSHRK
jgi:TRAP-type transport system periplasmic protein